MSKERKTAEERYPGFYWVRFGGKDPWEIAAFTDRDFKPWIRSNNYWYRDDDFYSINETRVLPPDEALQETASLREELEENKKELKTVKIERATYHGEMVYLRECGTENEERIKQLEEGLAKMTLAAKGITSRWWQKTNQGMVPHRLIDALEKHVSEADQLLNEKEKSHE